MEFNFERSKEVIKKTTLAAGLAMTPLAIEDVNIAQRENNEEITIEKTIQDTQEIEQKIDPINTSHFKQGYKRHEVYDFQEAVLDTSSKEIQKFNNAIDNENSHVENSEIDESKILLEGVEKLEERYSHLSAYKNEILPRSFTIISYSEMIREKSTIDRIISDETQVKIINEKKNITLLDRSFGSNIILEKEYKLTHSGLTDPAGYKEATYKKPEYYFIIKENKQGDSSLVTLNMVSGKDNSVQLLGSEKIRTEFNFKSDDEFIEDWKKPYHAFDIIIPKMTKIIEDKIVELGLDLKK